MNFSLNNPHTHRSGLAQEGNPPFSEATALSATCNLLSTTITKTNYPS
jgi:hypothetical protein